MSRESILSTVTEVGADMEDLEELVEWPPTLPLLTSV